MRKKLAAIAAAATLTIGAIVPAPANAVVQSAQNSSEAFLEDPVAAATSVFGLIVWGPVILSSMVPSFLGFEQCNLFDTRGCQ